MSRTRANVRPGNGYPGLLRIRRHPFSVIGHVAHPCCRFCRNHACATVKFVRGINQGDQELTSSRPGFGGADFMRVFYSPFSFIFVTKPAHQFRGNNGRIAPPGQQWNAVTISRFETLRLQGFPQKTGDHTSRGCFSLLCDLLDGPEDFIVNVKGGSHNPSLSHLMRDAIQTKRRNAAWLRRNRVTGHSASIFRKTLAGFGGQ
jgi:hypothetical protein